LGRIDTELHVDLDTLVELTSGEAFENLNACAKASGLLVAGALAFIAFIALLILP
jgi:hypothetical protein